jgi:multiple sugar transport system ATP-binding protein
VTHDQAEALTLADRIVVMRHGVVQQIGSPDAIYEQPRNMFVASFLGNPPINFLEGRLAARDGAMLFQRGELSLTLPATVAARVAGQDGREVVLGIRAEDVTEGAAAAGGDGVRGRILSVLPVGSDQFVEMEVEGTKLFFRLGKEVQHRDGENVSLGVNLNRLHLFDKQSTQSLVWH